MTITLKIRYPNHYGRYIAAIRAELGEKVSLEFDGKKMVLGFPHPGLAGHYPAIKAIIDTVDLEIKAEMDRNAPGWG